MKNNNNNTINNKNPYTDAVKYNKHTHTETQRDGHMEMESMPVYAICACDECFVCRFHRNRFSAPFLDTYQHTERCFSVSVSWIASVHTRGRHQHICALIAMHQAGRAFKFIIQFAYMPQRPEATGSILIFVSYMPRM